MKNYLKKLKTYNKFIFSRERVYREDLFLIKTLRLNELEEVYFNIFNYFETQKCPEKTCELIKKID